MGVNRFAQIAMDGSVTCVCELAFNETIFEGAVDESTGITYRELLGPVDPIFVLERMYWKEGWREKPLRPSEFHHWNQAEERWVGDIDGAVQARKQEVDQYLRALIQGPIQVGEILLDGDATAQSNLQAKLTEMKARLDLGLATPVELLVWRDYDNGMHTWDTLAEYYAWLAGYAVLLSTRGTLLYRQSWLHKEAIDALGSLDEVLAYDITQGWTP